MRAGSPLCCALRYVAGCATPLPNDQFSFLTSTRSLKTSSGQMPTDAESPSAMAL
jgi:hypothetical protein